MLTTEHHTPSGVAEPALAYQSGYRYLNVYTSPRLFSEDEYLQIERQATEKSEYVDGAIYAMSGASFRHSALISRCGELFFSRSKSKGCTIHFSGLRLHVPEHRSYFYPDVMMICGKPEFRDDHTDTVTNPTLLVEVLSPSTRKVDMELKAERYCQIESLRWYLIIYQDEPRLKVYSRTTDGGWRFDDYTDGERTLGIDILATDIQLAEIFEGIL